MISESLQFIYNEPALIAKPGPKKYLVIGDLHIGMERELSERGIHVYNATDKMAERIIRIGKEFSVKDLIILGDVKESILYPDVPDTRLIKGFFSQLSGFNIKVVAGNHDAHLKSLVDAEVVRELVLNKFAFVHGDKMPEGYAMLADYIIAAHNHAIVKMKDKNGAIYDKKVWVVSELNKSRMKQAHADYNPKIRLVVMPAFNDLIMGSPISRKNNMNPLLRNGIFKMRGARLYDLEGSIVDWKRII